MRNKRYDRPCPQKTILYRPESIRFEILKLDVVHGAVTPINSALLTKTTFLRMFRLKLKKNRLCAKIKERIADDVYHVNAICGDSGESRFRRIMFFNEAHII